MGNFSKLLPSDSLPKWQVALIVSIPVAFGLGYLYYKCNVDNKQIIISGKVAKEKDRTDGIVKEEIKAAAESKPAPVLVRIRHYDDIGYFSFSVLTNVFLVDAFKTS